MNAKGKVIATDLDGTLFFPKRRIRMLSTLNKNFIRRFIDDGGKVLLISGRNYTYLKRVVKKINRPVDYSGCNGSFLVVNNEMIKKINFDNAKLKQFLNELNDDNRPSGVFLMNEDYSFVVPKKSFGLFNRFGFVLYQLSQGVYQEKAYRDDELLKEQLDHGKIFKVMLFYGASRKKIERCHRAYVTFSRNHPEYEYAYLSQCIEMTVKGANKANAVKQYLDYLKIKHDNVMVVGDSGNDISMFRSFKNSFCMRHASVEISQFANHRIGNVYELEKYLK